MDLYYKTEVAVGTLVIAAVAILIVGVTWLSGKPFFGARESLVAVSFTNVSGLQTGDPVQVSGFNVGRVANITYEDVGRIMVYLEVAQRVRPHVDASARVASLDLLGAKFVDYTPGRSQQMLNEDQIITGSSGTDVLAGAAGLADQAAAVLTGLEGILTERMAADVQETLLAAQRALNTVDDLGSGPMADEATAAVRNVRRMTARLDSTLANPSIEKSINQFDEVTLSLQEMSEGLAGATTALSSILGKMDAGEGAFGKALNDSTLHTDLHALLVSMRQLLDDMRERPGRYFNLKVF